MKHLKTARFSPYQIFIGVLVKLPEIVKNVCKAILRHITEALMAVTFAGMFIAVQAFESGDINCITTLLIVTALGVLLVTLVKIKILEAKKDR